MTRGEAAGQFAGMVVKLFLLGVVAIGIWQGNNTDTTASATFDHVISREV